MEGISKEDVMSLIYTDDYANDLIDAEEAISLCEELPAQQWQTIDEFMANYVDGWCHISCGDKKELAMAFFEDGIFWYNDLSKGSNNFSHIKITHVMPIKTPEAPK